jgi:hypothetical protein
MAKTQNSRLETAGFFYSIFYSHLLRIALQSFPYRRWKDARGFDIINE